MFLFYIPMQIQEEEKKKRIFGKFSEEDPR
jgi:hypothetical protein